MNSLPTANILPLLALNLAKVPVALPVVTSNLMKVTMVAEIAVVAVADPMKPVTLASKKLSHVARVDKIADVIVVARADTKVDTIADAKADVMLCPS